MPAELIDEVLRSDRRTLSIVIGSDGRVVARAPERMPLESISRFAALKRDWIERKRREIAERMASFSERTFSDGEAFLFKGQPYPLEFVPESEARAPVFFDGGFKVSEPYRSRARHLLAGWYEIKAEQVIFERVRVYAEAFGIVYGNLRVADHKSQWGSCSARGDLSFSWRLVMCPMRIIDYVVAHELAHRKEMNHSPAFWELVARMRPDFRESRRWLKENAMMLRW